jgi:hypothetical protein
MPNDGVMRLRCPADIRDPSRPEKHYAVDIRLPLSALKRSYVADVLGNCSCGLEMIVLRHSNDPWVRT